MAIPAAIAAAGTVGLNDGFRVHVTDIARGSHFRGGRIGAALAADRGAAYATSDATGWSEIDRVTDLARARFGTIAVWRTAWVR